VHPSIDEGERVISPDEYPACATPAGITAEAHIGQVVGALLKEGVLERRGLVMAPQSGNREQA
jgi:hypothetical protein